MTVADRSPEVRSRLETHTGHQMRVSPFRSVEGGTEFAKGLLASPSPVASVHVERKRRARESVWSKHPMAQFIKLNDDEEKSVPLTGTYGLGRPGMPAGYRKGLPSRSPSRINSGPGCAGNTEGRPR
jgi:hypothetical protein